MNKTEHVIVIGSGPAGLTAAIYLARFGLTPLVIDGPQPGGQLMWTTYIENWPGIPKIRGSELMQNLRNHAATLGAQLVAENVTAIAPQKTESEDSPLFTVKTNKKSYQSKAVIIASGAHPRKLGCPGEEEYWGKGVSPCAVCDGSFFKDQQVVVVGGGNSGLENALFLRQYTDKITLIHVKPELTASEVRLREAVEKDSAIACIFNSTVTKIVGDGERVTGIEITNQKTKETTQHATAAVFVAVGQVPSSDFLQGVVDLTPAGNIALKNGTQTSVSGIFAAGDVADAKYRQAITAAATGCMAALDVQTYLAKR